MNKNVKSVLSVILYLVLVFAFTLFFILFVAQRTEVSGNSMEPTLQDGDSLIVNKLGYRLHDPERYDVVVFPFEHGEKTYFIKRIIGLPGETVRIDAGGSIYINDERLLENYGMEPIQDPGVAAGSVTLGEDEYFLLGDNRNDSMDSRQAVIGNIKRDRFIGKAIFRLFPLGKLGGIR